MLTIEGSIVNLDKVSRGRIEIGQDGIIQSVGKETGKADVVLGDELIFPGFIDLHVHARECANHAWDYKEDFTTSGKAAINGGVVAFADMPNNPVPPVDEKSFADKYQLAQKSAADVVLYAGIGPKTEPFYVSFRASRTSPELSRAEESLNFNNLSNLRDPSTRPDVLNSVAGPGRDDKIKVPYKVFMGQSVGDLYFKTRDELESAISKYRGQSVSFHCEEPEILEENKNQPTHELRRPEQAEILAVDFALELIKKYNLQGKICHCSTVEGLQKITAAKKSGLAVTVEVTPHHLFFDSSNLIGSAFAEPKHRESSAEALAKADDDSVIARSAADEAIITRSGIASDATAMTKLLQVNPPIRQSKENRLALIEALKKGAIDYLATDHAPHATAEKEKGMSGMPHLDTYGPFAAWLMSEHKFTPADVCRICSYNPGQFMNMFMNKKFGKIESGFVGSLTVLDMSRPITISKSMLKTKCAWSPFENIQFPGSVKMTIVRGKVFKL